ncbi:hypothetical protein O5585_27685, partial [Escherichia coli]|nr:hypothetical protein [Escherichia coli]
ASWANFAGALAGSAINATGAVFMAGAELAKPAGKIDDIAENQEQNTDKPDSQTRIKSKEDRRPISHTRKDINMLSREDFYMIKQMRQQG